MLCDGEVISLLERLFVKNEFKATRREWRNPGIHRAAGEILLARRGTETSL